MHKTWKQIQLRFLTITLSVLLSACGYTGPDSDENGNGGATPPPTGGTPPPTPPPTTPPTTPPSGDGFGADLADIEIVEGTPAMDGNVILPGGVDPIASLKFKLRNPLKSTARVMALIDEQRTDCGIGYMKRPTMPKTALEVPAGATEITIDASIYRDTAPEDDCNAAFELDIQYENSNEKIKSTGKLTIKDDDFATGNLHDDHTKTAIKPGAFLPWDLNGGRSHKGETYQITQLTGPTVITKVIEDKLRMLFPVPDSNLTDLSGGVQYRFEVTPSNAPSYVFEYYAHTSMRPATYFVEDDSSFVSGFTAQGYLRDHLVDEDLTKLRWRVDWKEPTTKFDILRHNFPLKREGQTIENEVSVEDRQLIRQAIILEADGHTLKLDANKIPALMRYINDENLFSIEVDLEADKGFGPDANKYGDVLIRLRPAVKKLTISLNGIDASPETDRYYLVLREQVAEVNGRVVRVLPFTGSNVTFENIHSGQYEITLADMNGQFTANTAVTLYKEDKQKDFTLTVRAAHKF